MRIAVTGGMGFIGHEIVRDLVYKGHQVFVVDFWKQLVEQYEKAKLPILASLYDTLPKCEALIEPWDFITDEQPNLYLDAVVHIGAVVDTMDLGSNELFWRNVEFTKGLVKNAEKTTTDIIFASSAAVYGNGKGPNNPYGFTKALGEKIMKNASGISTASLRFFNVFGRNEHHKGNMASVPWKIANTFKKGGQFELFNREAQRDFVPSSTIVSVVNGLLRQFQQEEFHTQRVYDVGTGVPLSFGKLVEELAVIIPDVDLAKQIKDIPQPAHLEGRYQFYTCAGKNGVENLGGNIGTAQGLLEAYGETH